MINIVEEMEHLREKDAVPIVWNRHGVFVANSFAFDKCK